MRRRTTTLAFALLFVLYGPLSAQEELGSGYVTGYFTNSNLCDPCSGLGTNVFSWGNPAPGSFQGQLTFTGYSFFNAAIGRPFFAGLLGFRNGALFPPSPTAVDLVVNTVSSNPAFNQTQTFRLMLTNTTNTTDPLASADFLSFEEYTGYGSFRVLEDRSTAVQIKGEFGSFHFAGFGQVTDVNAGFVTATTDVSDLTPVLDGTGPTVVPEPASLILLGTGLAGLGALRRKRAARKA